MELRLVNVIEAGLGFKGFRDVGMENRGLCLVKKETVGQGFSPANSCSNATCSDLTSERRSPTIRFL